MLLPPPPDELGARFLLLVESLVTDRGPIFKGVGFSIGVNRKDGTELWLCVKTRPEFRVGYHEAAHPDLDFSMLLDWDDAEEILKSGKLPRMPSRIEIRGDQTGLDRFVATYLSHQSPMSARLGAFGSVR